MPTVPECICCCEIDVVKEKIDENSTEINCITLHEGFEAVCLNVWVLQTALIQHHQRYGSVGGEIHRYVKLFVPFIVT